MFDSVPSPDSQSAAPAPAAAKPKRSLLKWSLLATAVLFAFLLWQCGSGLYQAAKTADVAVNHFHDLLNHESYEQILNEADAGFRDSGKRDELLAFFAGVHRKLGIARVAKRGGMNVNATTSGTFVTIGYTTTFEDGTAEETFVFKKTISGELKLFGYNVQSNIFITK